MRRVERRSKEPVTAALEDQELLQQLHRRFGTGEGGGPVIGPVFRDPARAARQPQLEAQHSPGHPPQRGPYGSSHDELQEVVGPGLRGQDIDPYPQGLDRSPEEVPPTDVTVDMVGQFVAEQGRAFVPVEPVPEGDADLEQPMAPHPDPSGPGVERTVHDDRLERCVADLAPEVIQPLEEVRVAGPGEDVPVLRYPPQPRSHRVGEPGTRQGQETDHGHPPGLNGQPHCERDQQCGHHVDQHGETYSRSRPDVGTGRFGPSLHRPPQDAVLVTVGRLHTPEPPSVVPGPHPTRDEIPQAPLTPGAVLPIYFGDDAVADRAGPDTRGGIRPRPFDVVAVPIASPAARSGQTPPIRPRGQYRRTSRPWTAERGTGP